MSRVRRRQGLAAWRKALHLRMRRLRQADLGDGRHDHAWFEAAFARMVLGRLSHGHPFEWDFGAAIAKTARARLLQVGVAAVRQAAPRHGRAGPRAARRPRRGRRGRDPVADQGRSGLRRRRPLAPGQNVGRRRRRSRKRRPRTPSPGRDQGLLRRLAAWLRRRQRRPGRDDQNRRLAVLRPRPRRPARAPCRRRHGRPCRSALGPPRLLQRQELGARRLSRPAKTASPELPRRIRLPLQPTPNPPRRLPLPSRNRPRPQTTNLQYVDHAGSSGIRLCFEIYREAPVQYGSKKFAFFGAVVDIHYPTDNEESFESILARYGDLAEYERGLSRLLYRNIRRDELFLDIGAQIGLFSVLASLQGARVVSFEMRTSLVLAHYMTWRFDPGVAIALNRKRSSRGPFQTWE